MSDTPDVQSSRAAPATALLVLPAGFAPDEHWLESVRSTLPSDMRVLVPDVPADAVAADVVLAALDGVSEEYLLLLRAGDHLLTDGLRECLSILREDPEARVSVVGSFKIRGDHTSVGGTVRELSVFRAGVPADQFLLAGIERPFTVPLSGVVLPVRTLRRFRRVLRLFSRSPRWGSLAATLPGTTLIRQCSEPLASIHLGVDAAGETVEAESRSRWFQIVPSLYLEDDVISARLLTEIFDDLRANRDIRGSARVLSILGRSLFWPSGKHPVRSLLLILRWLGERLGVRANGGDR